MTENRNKADGCRHEKGEKGKTQAAEMNVSRNTSYYCGAVIQAVQL
jgi:hypothetical protein